METRPAFFYFDFVSPFAYLASTQIEAVGRRHARQIDWRPVLVGVTVKQVMKAASPPDLPLKGPYLRNDAIRLAQWLDVPFAFHSLPAARPVLALRIFLLLKRRDERAAVHFAQRVFERLWVHGFDITNIDDLASLLVDMDEDPSALSAAASEQPAKDALKDAVEEAIAEGVFGVPFFKVGGESLWGVDRLPMLEHWLEHGTWSRRKLSTVP